MGTKQVGPRTSEVQKRDGTIGCTEIKSDGNRLIILSLHRLHYFVANRIMPKLAPLAIVNPMPTRGANVLVKDGPAVIKIRQSRRKAHTKYIISSPVAQRRHDRLSGQGRGKSELRNLLILKWGG